MHYELRLSPWEAALGTNVLIPTLSGSVNIRVPQGTQNGQKLRVKGRGLPDREGVHGDLYVVTRIEVPKSITERERQLWEQLRLESKFKPRD